MRAPLLGLAKFIYITKIYGQGEFDKQSRVGDHFFYSHNLTVWFRGDTMGRS